MLGNKVGDVSVQKKKKCWGNLQAKQVCHPGWFDLTGDQVQFVC